MAKRPRSRKKRVKFGEAVKALRNAGVPHQEFGRVQADGTHKVDPTQIAKLKKKLGKARSRNVRFVALNAPFKRRSPIPPA
jgi:nickel-dependent lactate racemase